MSLLLDTGVGRHSDRYHDVNFADGTLDHDYLVRRTCRQLFQRVNFGRLIITRQVGHECAAVDVNKHKRRDAPHSV